MYADRDVRSPGLHRSRRAPGPGLPGKQALLPAGARAVRRREVELEGGVGWGPPSRVDFFIRQGEPTAPLHVAFAALDRATVDAFHAAALDAGGLDNGAPGLRPRYHRNYYGGYVIDLDS